jgi:transcription antitermination protein NusB
MAIPKSRRAARELALRGLYQHVVTGYAADVIAGQLLEYPESAKADQGYFQDLLAGAIRESDALGAILTPHLDRPLTQLSPVELACLRLAAFELSQRADIPYRVVINEAVELAKKYGGADGHKYVNAVLDKLAAVVRPAEITPRRKAVPRRRA